MNRISPSPLCALQERHAHDRRRHGPIDRAEFEWEVLHRPADLAASGHAKGTPSDTRHVSPRLTTRQRSHAAR